MRRIVVVLVVGLMVVAGCSSKKKASPKSTTDDHVSAWTTVGIGSVYVSKTMTRMQKPFAHETETTTKQTLVGRDKNEASVKLEITEGTSTTAQEIKVPLRQDPPAAAHDGSKETINEEVCTVPAGTFQCTRTTREVQDHDTTRSTVTWMAKTVPVPLRSIVTNENMTITTELVSLSVVP